ncbi:RNA polymerase sigma factor [Saccharospirillum salsuginis]|nr:RNA polymerase sigma factor [Saccharospirillum salsuginis]
MTNDRTLVTQALDGSAEGFKQLVAQHQALVWHVVYRMVHNEEDARELSQDVFLRVFQRLGQFRFESSLATWIGRIAYSRAVRHLERKRLPLVADEDAVLAVPDPGADSDPLVGTDRARNRARVQAALSRLAPLPRTIVSLYHLQGLTTAEIALMTDLPAGTVKSHLFRARQSLKTWLTEEEIT